jgi:hypothetical protein
MNGLSAPDIVRVWERGALQHPIDRALTILAAAVPETGDAALGDLPIGERNRRLLAIRARTFGEDIEALATCTACGERVAMHVPATVLGDRLPDPGAGSDRPPDVRRLTSRDLAAAARCADAGSARLLLARRALADAATGDETVLAPEAVEAVGRRLQEIDPLAVVLLDVHCPACGAAWECELDVAEFLWIEIEAQALRVLRDVHVLASAYGWREVDILALSPLRRRAYLELVQ